MFNFLKSKKNKENQPDNPESPQPPESGKTWFKRLRAGLTRTRTNLFDGVATILLGKKVIDAELFEELETVLLTADVGVEATQTILENLRQHVKRHALNDPQALIHELKQQLLAILQPCAQALTISGQPFTLLMVGVNGSGKQPASPK